MKKLSLFAIIVFIISCEDAEMYVEPEGNDFAVSEVIVEESDSEPIFLVVEESPTFPGGVDAYNKFLLKNLQYPAEAKQYGIEGNVYLSFVVDTDGTLVDFQLLRNPGGGLGAEALRVYMEGPNWNPGLQRKRPVKTRITARVAFRLHDKSVTSIRVEQPKKVNEMISSEQKVREIIFEKEGNN